MNFFKRTQLKEYIFSILLVVPFALILIFSSFFLSPMILLIVSLTLFCFGINFLVRNVSKIGVYLLFFFTYAILTINISELGIIGIKKILAFIIGGVIFELIVLSLRKKVKLKSVLGTVLSVTILPFVAALLISPGLAITFPIELISLILLLLLVSLVSSLVYIILWHYIRVRKPLIKLKSYLGSLNKH
jgi:hypothetical protein